MKKNLFLLLFVCSTLSAFALYIPPAEKPKEVTQAVARQHAMALIKDLSVEEFQKVTGKKLTGLQKWQYRRLHARLNKGKAIGIFPEREDLTEGFQALPFFGSLLTFGLVAIVMLFTARDRNALSWAWNAVWLISLGLAVLALIMNISGY